MADTRATFTLAANLDPSGVLSAVKAMQGAFNSLKLPDNIGEGLDKSLSKATDLLKKYQGQLAKGVNTKTDAKSITKTGAQINEVLDEISHYINDLNGQQIFLKADVGGLNKLQAGIENARTAWKNAIQEFRKGSDIDKVLGGIGEKTTRSNLTQGSINKAKTLFDKGDLEGYQNALDEIYSRVSKLKDTTISSVVKGLGLDDAGSKAKNLALIKAQLEAISKIDFSSDANVKTQFDEITNAVNTYEAEVKRAGDAGQQAFNDINANSAVSNTRALVDATDQYTNSIMNAKDQVQDLQRSTQYFFSLRNMLNLLKRGIDDAIQSVKELDAAMTETAVVTDYKVSDLWGMLPQYTQLANQLGATTQGAYETMTLYFQQGLDQQQAFEIGAETMKMARIAGLDYAETTDMMTAALRGFNMELNETSAKRINDVYSELAAITASDTEELGTAMQRTASIAHSAGMSFEGTTAFLAQAIETTREPAENIGTAMKTIVARFQEMKQNPLKISEVDGEEVDYNKVDAALQSIGVSLKDTNGQFRQLDQVFLDISSRWDSLSQTQQRYIATVAAGSRQQSRFIAMMDNYDRTMQLFEAANNSAGASDEQFGKTMDSLESKLNKLHNAWQQFTMGIANNSMIKLAVDGMTGLLTITNKLIDAFSLGFGPLKSFLSVFTAFTGLKVAGRAANSLIGGLGGLVDPQSTVKEGLKIGLFGQGKTNAQAQAITTPIVGVLNKISGQIAQIKNNGVNNNKGQSSSEVKNTSKQEYLDIKKQFGKLSGKEGFKMSDASNLFGKLDTKHQLSMFNNNPGTKYAMKQASLAWFGSRKDLSKAAIQEGQTYISSIYKGMEQGRIPVDKGIELIGQPQKWGHYLGTETAMAYSQSFIQKAIPTMKENTAIAHEAAISSLGFNPQDYKVGSKELKDLFKNDKQLATEYASLYSGFRGDLDDTGHGQARGKVSDMGRFANDIGSVADKFTQAGYGITTFGNALSQLGGPLGTIGSGISALGGAITTMGMSISGVTGIISLFTVGIQDAAGATVIAGSTIAAVAAPLAILAAGFLLAKAHLQKVKEAGEEVTKTFNDTNKEVDGNISKLKSYQSEFATLSQGVDSNGNNVSLDDSQYQRYLEIVDDIAKINPEIVQGYNAQGHAIIDNNKALDETLKKQQQIKKEALDTYTKQGSLQKLINARNINKDYKQIQSTKQSGVADGSGHGNEGRPASIGSAVPLAGDVSSIADKLRLTSFDPASLKKFGIESLDDLLEGEEQAVKNFIKHRDQIQAELANSGIELNEGLIKGFDKLNKDQKAFDKAIQPVYDNLLTSVSNSPFYKEIGSEFKSAIALGLKDIASQDLSASEMQSQANSLVQEFDNLTREGSKYTTAMEQVENAQDKFASSLDVSEYAKNTEGALSTLNSLLKEYEGNTTAYGQAVTEYLTNQIEKIKNFTEEGSTSLTEALNGMTNTISAAEGAYDSFQESTKTDFSTGAQSMKSIFEEVTKETDGVMLHMEKFGDATMWKGARALLGDEFVEKNGENVELVKKELLSLKSELQDGEKGFAAFWDNFKKVDDSKIEGFTWNKDGSYDIDRDINPDAYKEIAEQMHRSEEYVVSMLNKGRQFADIDFTNIDDVRKALSTDSGVIAGTGTTGGERDLYVKKDYLQNAMSEAGIVNPSEQAKETEKLLAKGIKVIPNAKDMTKDDFKSMGINDLPSLVQKLGDTGQFNRSEIEEYAQQLEGEGYNAKELDTVYDDYLSSQEHPELPSLNSIEGNVQTIASIISSNRIQEGYVDQSTKDAYEEAKKIVNGENGHNKGEADSVSEFFALGKNTEGKALSESEYNSTLKLLDKQIDTYTTLSKQAEEGAKKAEAEGREEDAKFLQKMAKGYETLAKWTEEDKKKGTGVHENLQNEQESTKQKAPGMPSDVNRTLDKQAQDRKLQADADAVRAEGLAKQTEEINKQKKAQQAEQAAADAVRAAGLAKQTEEINKQKEAQRKAQEEQAAADAARAAGLVKQTEEYNKQKQIQEESKRNLPEGVETVTPENIDQYNGGKNIAGAHNFIGDLIKSVLSGDWTSDGEEAVSTASEKASNIWQKMWNGVNQVFAKTPEITTPTQSAGSAIASTIGQGASSLVTSTQEVIQKVTTQEQGVDETQQKLETISSTASQGAEMKVSTADSAVQTTLNAIQGLQKVANKGVSVKTTTTSGGGADKIKNAAAKGADMPIRVNDQATPKIKSIESQAKKPVHKTVTISPTFTGSWQKTATINVQTNKGPSTGGFITNAGVLYRAKGGSVFYPKKGTDRIPAYLTAGEYVQNKGAVDYFGIDFMQKINHKDLTGALQSFGSLAKGTKSRYGRIGPQNKGGLTLTGETGYEVAWLPSENRSMILGTSGPEMVNLPKDAVVYNHDQSKQIMRKRQGIFAGSMDSGGPYNSGGSGSSSSSRKSSKNSSKKSSKKSKKSKKGDSSAPNNWSIEEVVRFDIDRKLETLASKIKKATDDIDKKLGKIGLKASGIAKDTQAQVKNLQAVKTYNDNLAASYQKDLNKLAGGPYKTKISYSTGSGKKSKSKEETVNLANYIYRDGNGDYQIDRNAIANAGSVEKQEAIFKAAESALNPLVSGLQKAKDAAADAQKQMDELGKKVSETFYQWENEITEVYNLTQRISHDESLRARFSSQVALQLSKLKAGFGDTAQSIDLMHRALERDNKVLLEQIENQQKMIGARQRELNAALSAQDELDELNRLRAKSYDIAATKNATIEWATDNYQGARLGRNYLNNVRQDRDGSLRYDIDWARFERDRKADPYNKNTYEAIKKYLDELNSATDEFNKSIQEQTDLIKETYDALREYQDYVADFEDTLLKGFEEEIENNIDNSKRISESISDTLKDLLDQVKRKLDERRQQEDNRKTEEDISRKQQRLAMLRADTSGGHAAEIAQLESEIADSQQSYQRTLEDQLLDKLQQQGDEAAKQRERQIEIAQAQLEVATNGNTAIVDMWLRDPEAYKEEIKKAWLEAQGYDEKGEAGQYILASQFESEFANLVTAIDQSGFSNGFKAVSDDTNTLVGLLTKLTEGRDALTDSLSKAAGALQDVENRDTESFELGKRTQLSAAQWKKEGQTASSLKNWGYTFDELKKSGFTNAELKQAGFGIKDFTSHGTTNPRELHNLGFKAKEITNELGLQLKDLVADPALWNSISWSEVSKGNYSLTDYINAGIIDANRLRKAGFTLGDLKSNSTIWSRNSWQAIKNAGYSAADYKNAGLSYSNAIASGFSDNDLYSYYSEAQTKIDNANRAAANRNAYNNAIAAAHQKKTVTKATLQDAINKGAAYGVGKNAYQVSSDLANGDGDGGVTWKEVMKQLKALGYSGKTVKNWNPYATKDSSFRKAFVDKYGKWSKFATGGLASFTGPAWLDGTPSKPELVLNATDTKNFIALKDVLAHAMDSTGQINNSYGGNATYEININVDHLNNDYDVDKVVERVKKKIVQDAGYRNVTQVRKFR